MMRDDTPAAALAAGNINTTGNIYNKINHTRAPSVSSSATSPTTSQSPHPNKRRRESRVSVSTGTSISTNTSISTTASTKAHQEYLNSLRVPSTRTIQRIAEVQEQNELSIIRRRLSAQAAPSGGEMNEQERQKAAELIQRNYRGHRERRMLNGLSLDPSTRWVEAVKEARYRHLTEPRPRTPGEAGRERMSGDGRASMGSNPGTSNAARQNWRKIGMITRRAGADEESDDSGTNDEAEDPKLREERLRRKHEAKVERQKAAKIMDLQYFLEMVDLKHRYGSNLRTYHEEWQKADTFENFFYWLDFGEGQNIEVGGCTREQLDRERVRYLSKEERLDYLVKIDKEGRLCWAKNGMRIDTTEEYKDSIHGIVSATDNSPPFRHASQEAAREDEPRNSTSSASSQQSEGDRANKYTNPELDNSKGMKKVKHVSAATVFNKLLRGSVKKNTWIFVADTSFRLYVGIKQSGAFQHSSFLHGSRISAAGLIKIKDGRLDKLSPLSGHYRPPVSNFRAFIHNLKENQVDMSHVSISRSYAVLVGLEAYVKTRRKGKKFLAKLTQRKEKIMSPEEAEKREWELRDKSESAEKERRYLERKEREEKERRENLPWLEKLHLNHSVVGGGGVKGIEKKGETDIQAPGMGPENAIAPEGTR